MVRRGYSYRPPRSRLRRWRRWLPLLPVAALAVLVVATLSFGLPGRGTHIAEVADSVSSCPPDTDCDSVPPTSSPTRSAPTPVSPAAASAASVKTDKPRPVVTQTLPPEVSGQAIALVEEPCGILLYGLNENARLAPASLTKIVTALVAVERTELSAMVNVDVDGEDLAITTDSTVMGLKPGQTVSMRDLLYGLLLPSGNDAAIAIAEHVGGSVSQFVNLMNQRVAQSGLTNTHFTNPHGLDEPGLYTSAFDIVTLGRELLRQPELASIVATHTYKGVDGLPLLWNSNWLLYSYPGAIGIKNGYTDEAKQTIVAAAERDGRRLIVAVLKSDDMYTDAAALLDWAFTSVAPGCR